MQYPLILLENTSCIGKQNVPFYFDCKDRILHSFSDVPYYFRKLNNFTL